MGQGILARGYSRLRFNLGLLQRLFKLTPVALGLFYGIVIFTWGMVIASFLVLLMLIVVYKVKFNISILKQLKNFFIPNLILIVTIFLDEFFLVTTPNWVLALIFIFLHLLVLLILKHESYKFSKNILLSVIKKVK
jgi:hypothetical protein